MGFEANLLSRATVRLFRPRKARIAERIRVSHETILIVRKGRATYEAFVSDLNQHGFMVQANAAIRFRDLIEINLPCLGWIAAQVRWTGDNGRLGCKFLDPIDPVDFDLCLSLVLSEQALVGTADRTSG